MQSNVFYARMACPIKANIQKQVDKNENPYTGTLYRRNNCVVAKPLQQSLF